MTRIPTTAPLLVCGLSLLLLTGCVTGAATSEPTPTASSAPETSADSTPEPTATAITCDTVLTEPAYAELEADGLTPVDAQVFDPFAAQLVEAGATTCAWGRPQSDTGLTVVALAVTAADMGAWHTTLAETGYVLTDDPVPGAHTGPVEPGTGVPTVVVMGDDRITFLNTAAFAASVATGS